MLPRTPSRLYGWFSGLACRRRVEEETTQEMAPKAKKSRAPASDPNGMFAGMVVFLVEYGVQTRRLQVFHSNLIFFFCPRIFLWFFSRLPLINWFGIISFLSFYIFERFGSRNWGKWGPQLQTIHQRECLIFLLWIGMPFSDELVVKVWSGSKEWDSRSFFLLPCCCFLIPMFGFSV